jgi:hypothetical protein
MPVPKTATQAVSASLTAEPEATESAIPSPPETETAEPQLTETPAQVSASPSPTAVTYNCSESVEMTLSGDVFSYKGVQFSVDPGLNLDFTVRECEDGFEFGDLGRFFPAYLLFTSPSPLPNNRIQPEIRVFEISSDMQSYSYPLSSLNTLQQELRRQPEPSTWYAGVVLHTGEKYLDFYDGTGIRGIVAYFQDLFFWNNNTLQYTFNGLSNDGRYFISADFPLNAPFLIDVEAHDPLTNTNPQAILIPGWPDNFDEQQKIVEEYNREAFRRFELAAPADFTPNLDLYDALVQSFRVGLED